MKKLFFIFLFSLITGFISKAQEVKKVNNTPPETYYWEQYYVLKSDENIKHGSYKQITSNGKTLATGFYKLGKEDSLWTNYFVDTKIVSSQGAFKNGKRVGVWKYFNREEKLLKQFEYPSGNLISFEYTNGAKKEYEVKTNDGIKKVFVTRPPMFVEPKFNDKSFFQGIVYPTQAYRNGIEGTVYISFFINKNGEPYDFEVKKGLGYGCDEEALKFAKLKFSKLPFLPAMINEEIVEARYIYPILFSIR